MKSFVLPFVLHLLAFCFACVAVAADGWKEGQTSDSMVHRGVIKEVVDVPCVCDVEPGADCQFIVEMNKGVLYACPSGFLLICHEEETQGGKNK